MKVLIEINCEHKTHLFTHLSVIRAQLKHVLKGVEDYGEPTQNEIIQDSNCYGDHEVKIQIED